VSAHLVIGVIDAPLRAIRPVELGATGLPAPRVRNRGDHRWDLRALVTHSTTRHRVTFIPLDNYTLIGD
jgi:hypothetical protein